MSQSFYSLSNLMLRGKNLLKVFVLGLGISGVAHASIPTFDMGANAQLLATNIRNQIMQKLTEDSFNTQNADMDTLKGIFGAEGGIGSFGSFDSVGGMGGMNILGASKSTHNDVTKGSQAAKDGVNKQELKNPSWVEDEVLNSEFLKGSVYDGVYGRSGGNMGQVYNELKDSLNCDHVVKNANKAVDTIDLANKAFGTDQQKTTVDQKSNAKARCEEQISTIVVQRYLIKKAWEKVRASEKALQDIYANKVGKESTAKASQDAVASIEAIRARLKIERARYETLLARIENRNQLELQRSQIGKQAG